MQGIWVGVWTVVSRKKMRTAQARVERLRSQRLKLPVIVGVTLLSITTTNCTLFQSQPEGTDGISTKTLGDGQTRIENQAKGISLTVPNGWTRVETLRPDADIYAAYAAEDLYVLVLADDKDSLVGQFSLDDNSSQYRRLLVRQLDRYDGQRVTDVTSVNGQDTVQYELRGQVEGTPVVYLHTTIRGNQNYYQVIAWTRADQYEQVRSQLQTVIISFRGS